ncbi:SPW repeat domain-containing protein [Arthrobacter alpinus]|uniref:SPW repeat domain-containing protein n=1 Tax=Arthrobacter alpinus TaxID=656366 RepID=UPI000A82EA56|nr:SPW repeat protein [Arthrobacter alpinus]
MALILAPWFGSYTAQTGAAWISWIAGADVVIATGFAFKPSNVAHHNAAASH